MLPTTNWAEHRGRYDPTRDDLQGALIDLHEDGWEIGVHGSLASGEDPDRMATEAARIARIVDGAVRGGRQHHLEHTSPETWRHQ